MQRKRTMQFFHTFYLVIIAILMTLLFVERQSQTTVTSHAEFQAQLSDQLANVEQELSAALSALHETVETQLNDLNTSIERDSDIANTYTRALPASAQQPPLDRLQSEPADTPEPTTPEPDSLTNTQNQPPLTSTDFARLGAAINDSFNTQHERFEMQSVDPDWAYPTRERIETLFYQHDYLRDLQLLEVECRSTLCRVDLSASHPHAINPARLLQALNELNSDIATGHVQLNSQPQDFGYRVYIQQTD